MDNAFQSVKVVITLGNPLSKLWIGTCNIYEHTSITDPVTHQTKQGEVEVVSDEPCQASYDKEYVTDIVSGAPVIRQSVTLFLRPDLTIPAGSVIEVTQHGITTKYKGSGKPAVYSKHQQINLELYEENA